MGRLELRALPVTAFAATVVIEFAAIGLSWGLEPYWDTLLYAVYTATLAGAGALIASRHPGNAVGWLFCGFGLFNAVAADYAQGWGLRAAEQGWVGGSLAELVATSSWLPSGVGTVLAFLLFPNGRLPSRRWRVVAVMAVVGGVLGTVGWALDADTGREFAVGHNPYAVESLPTGPMFAVGFAIVGAALLAAALSLAVRLYRAKGIERLQLKWFVFAAGAAAVVPSVVFFFWYTVPALRPLTALALTAVPVAACIAILRYRLYDIDLIISRTLIYGVLTVMLGGSYVATTLLLGVAVGQGSSLATAGATLVVAIAFRPLRDRVQGRVDRSFSRARYDAMRRMRAFLDDLRVGRAAPEDVEMAMREALSDPTLELRFFLPESGVEVDSRGRPVSGGSDAGRLRTPLTRGGVCLGEIVHAPRTEAQRVLVAPVVEAAELPVEIARLRVELRRQLDEVKDSRRRIVQAAEHERHRLERDLHDGAQQRLVSIGLALRHAQHALGPDPPHDAITTLDGALAEIAVAIEELRELARGIRPSCLDEGLGPALRELAGKARLPVEVRANGERFAPDLETAAYFIACEGLTNAVKHARATHVTLAVDRIDDTLVVSVSDDGVGARTLRTGTGLTGLSDRVAAHGGSLRIETSEGDGTILVAALPCAS